MVYLQLCCTATIPIMHHHITHCTLDYLICRLYVEIDCGCDRDSMNPTTTILIAFLLSSSVWYILAWSCVEACANSTIYLCRLKAIIVMELGRVIITISRILWAHSIINIIEYVINWSNCGKLECGRQRDAWWWQTATTTTTTTTALPCHPPRPSQEAGEVGYNNYRSIQLRFRIFPVPVFSL